VTEEDVVRGIRRCWSYSQALHIDQLFTNPAPLQVSEQFRDAALSPRAAYEEVYLTGLAGGEYNILLADYAFLQFGRLADNEVRYAYYPNPFLGASREAVAELADLRSYVDEELMSYEEFLQRVGELRFSQHPPLIRYENSEEQYVELTHPCSHLHIGHHPENRWPLRRVLTPHAFALMVFKYYYLDFWMEADRVSLGQQDFDVDELLVRAKQDCRILPDHLFNDQATRQFFTD
jgi:hypothetical protein